MQIIMAIVVGLSMIPYLRFETTFLQHFDAFAWRQQRIDMQAEQLAISPWAIRQNEINGLKSVFIQSIIAQSKAAIAFGLFALCSYLTCLVNLLDAFVLPAVIFFQFSSSNSRNADTANNITAVSVYVSMIQGWFITVNWGIGQGFSQVWIVGQRVVVGVQSLKTLKSSVPDVSPHHGDHPHITVATSVQSDSLAKDTKRRGGNEQQNTLSINHLDVLVYDRHHIGNMLIKDLTFSLPHDKNLLIRGSSGCGKSQLLRLLAGLLPLQGSSSKSIYFSLPTSVSDQRFIA
jgi:ABC-type multidrug transport system fused ATPase/permease subunit